MQTEDGRGRRADVVVVGTGAAGCTVAGQALRAGRSVVLVEAGTQRGPGRPGRHLRNDAPHDDELDRFATLMRDGLGHHGLVAEQGGDVAGFRVVHAVGGGMTLWFNNCPEPAPHERNAAVPDADWPDLLRRARSLLRVRVSPASVRQERLVARLSAHVADPPAGRHVQPMPLAVAGDPRAPRFAGADDLLLGDDAAPSGALQLLAGRVARRLVRSGDRVTGVEVHPVGGGPAALVEGDHVVVAAGTVGTPQLLFASGFEHPALGAYLMDHTMLSTRIALHPDVLAGVTPDDPSYAVWVPASQRRPWHTQLSRTPYLEPLPDVPDSATGDLISFGPVRPRQENRLVFDRSRTDGLGLPAYAGRFGLADDEVELTAVMVADHFRLRSAITAPGREWRPTMPTPGTSLHLTGTCRTGRDDDGTSVADPHSRVWGTANLYVGGNGVLSEPHSCNPTLQTVALALRCADHIVGRPARALLDLTEQR